MRRAMVALAFLASTAGAATWTSNGPFGGMVNALVASPSDSRLLMAGNAAGVFRSEDGGETWRDVSGGLRDVSYLAIDPRDGDVVYAVAGQRVVKSVTGGGEWVDITGSLGPLFYPNGLLLDPQNPDIVYVAKGCFYSVEPVGVGPIGVFKSSDGGRTWRSTLFGGLLVACTESIALDPGAPSRVFAKSQGGSSLESHNGAETWSFAARVPARDVVDHPLLPLTRFGLASDAVLVSRDGGLTWTTAAGVGLTTFTRFNDLTIDPGNGRLFLTTASGLFRSGDGGEHWISAGAPPLDTRAVVFDEKDARLVIGTSRGVFYGPAPGGAGWTRAFLGDIAANVVMLRAGDGTVDAFSTDGRQFHSDDAAASWVELTDPFSPGTPPGYPRGFAQSPSEPNIVYKIERIGDVGSALWISEQFGNPNTWRRLFYPGEMEFGTALIAVHPQNAREIFVSTAGGSVLRSGDGGRTWANLTDSLPRRQVYALAVDLRGAYLYAGLENGGVWRLPLRASPGRSRAVR